MLKRIFNFWAEARHERMKYYRDYYAKKSYKTDKMSNKRLVERIDKEGMISIGEVKRVMSSLTYRKKFRLSLYDMDNYISPVYNSLKAGIERGHIPCYARPKETLLTFGVIRTSDFLDIVDACYPPDKDAQTTIYGVQDVSVPIDPDFGDSSLGKLRQKFYDAFPLRTPSAPVRYEQKLEEREVDVRRMFILALGYADSYRKEDLEGVPLYIDTVAERYFFEQNKRKPRKYRGHDY